MSIEIKKILSSLKEDGDDRDLPIDIYFLMIVVLLGSVIIFAPQIYIKNNIYYKSRSINKLYLKYQALKDESDELNRVLEKLYFRQSNQK